jgi:hypothetical protein
MNGFVRFLKSKSKSFGLFLNEMREAIRAFFAKIMSVVQSGASALVGTIVSEIFGPVVSTFKKLASFIKQGVSSFIDTIKYLRDKSNRNKPLSVKIAQVGKIITAGLSVGGAIVLGEVFEKILLTVPGMQMPIPLLGSLANIIGLFLGSLISGIIGAIILNLLDKLIAQKLKAEAVIAVVEKQNEVLNIQQIQKVVAERKVVNTKSKVANEIIQRHEALDEAFERAASSTSDPRIDKIPDAIGYKTSISQYDDDFVQMQKELADLL